MARTLHPRLWVLLGAGLSALIAWFVIPGTALDRAAFSTVNRGFANPPFFISGNGSQAKPWNLRTFATRAGVDGKQAPLIVSLGDDPDGFFQSKPPSPIDLAVIFTNFQRLGATKAASAAVLAWDEPDPIGLLALDQAIARFDQLIMAAPLSRGAVPEAMPPAFRKASLPLSQVAGDSSALPIVNRIPLPGVVLGKDNTLAGFQTLDTEPASRFPHMLARWEDRVVLAFPLLTVLQRFGLPAEGIEIRLGEFLKLGPDGPIVPIDIHGRLAMTVRSLSPYQEIPAELLIDGGDELLPDAAPEPLVLRDDMSAAEPATRGFSARLSGVIAALASDTGLSPARRYPRLSTPWETALLGLVLIALAASCRLDGFSRGIAFLLIASVATASLWLAAGLAATWVPALPALAAVLCAAGITPFLPSSSHAPPRARKPRRKKLPAPETQKPTKKTTPEKVATPPAPNAPKPPPRKKAKSRQKGKRGRR